MTLREKAIVTAFTGVAMCVHDELNAFYEYVESLGLTGLYTHDYASVELWEEIKRRSKPDFIKLCTQTDSPDESVQSRIEDLQNQIEKLRAENYALNIRLSLKDGLNHVNEALRERVKSMIPEKGAPFDEPMS